MGVVSAHFYAANEGIAYPVDDAATGIDDAGRRLPSHLVVDLSLRWPETLGRYAFLSSASIRPAAVTLTIQAADAPDAAAGFAPLAVVTVPKPATPGRVYPLTPQAAGVGGWVVFGSGVADAPYDGRFASPAQSRLAARAARAYPPPPVSGVQPPAAAAALTGVVRLRAVAPLELAAEDHEIEGVVRRCIVFRLVDAEETSGFAPPAEAAALLRTATAPALARFAGPCGGRPESQSCGDPQPIEFLNGVGPDCDGVLTIELAGCAAPISVAAPGTAVLSCALGLADACAPKPLPDDEGRLPGDYGGRPSYAPIPDDALVSASGAVDPSDCLVDFAAGDTGGSEVGFGLWEVVPDPELSIGGGAFLYATNTAASRNVAVLACGGDGCLDRAVTARCRLRAGPTGAKRNASAIACWQPALGSTTQHVYYAATADYDTQRLLLQFFDGVQFQLLGAALVPWIRLDRDYLIELSAQEAGGGPPTLTAVVTDADDPAFTAFAAAAAVAVYPPTYGRFGIGSDRAIVHFLYASVES